MTAPRGKNPEVIHFDDRFSGRIILNVNQPCERPGAHKCALRASEDVYLRRVKGRESTSDTADIDPVL